MSPWYALADAFTDHLQLMYSGEMTGIVAMSFAKISLLFLFYRIVNERRRSFIVTGIAVAVWIIFALFAVSFKCGLPDPWDTSADRCPTRGRIEFPIIALNMFTDVLLSFGMLPSIHRLRMPKILRVKVMILFGARIM